MISCLERRRSLSLDPRPMMADIKCKLVLGRSNGVHLSPVLHDASLAWIRNLLSLLLAFMALMSTLKPMTSTKFVVFESSGSLSYKLKMAQILFVASDRLIWSSYLICTLPRQAMFTSELISTATDVLYGASNIPNWRPRELSHFPLPCCTSTPPRCWP